MIDPNELRLGRHPLTRVALRSNEAVIHEAGGALRDAWEPYEAEPGRVYHVPMPRCPEKVVVDLGWSRPAELVVGVYADQFKAYYLTRGSMHPLASSVLVSLLTTIKEEIGPVIETCGTVVDDEIDRIASGGAPGSILTYCDAAPLLADKHTSTDLTSPMGDPIARVLWEDLRMA